MSRLRFIAVGAVAGLTWAASLRAFMMQLAGPSSVFTFGGTFGIILPAGTSVGALLGWAEYQRRAGHQYRLLVAAPLLLGLLPILLTGQLDASPATLAVAAMIGGYAVSGRGPRWTRILAALIGAGAAVAPFIGPRSSPDLSITTAHGAWTDTLLSSLFVVLALACSIPMLRQDPDQVPGEPRRPHQDQESPVSASVSHTAASPPSDGRC